MARLVEREKKATFTSWLLGLIQTNKALELKRDYDGFLFFLFVFSPHLLIICALYYYTEAFLFSPVLSLDFSSYKGVSRTCPVTLLSAQNSRAATCA